MTAFRRRAATTLYALALVSPTGFCHDLTIDFLLGSDSNPNQMAETFEPEGAPFGQTRIDLSHMPTRTGFYYDLEAEGSFYQTDEEAVSDPSLADETRTRVELGFKWRPQMDYGRGRFMFELFGQTKDSTYVDHSSGQIATFNRITPPLDEQIEDRFDYSYSGFFTSGSVPISTEAFFVYDIEYLQKTYQDYPNLELEGLDNLDYEQYELDIGFEKWIWPRTNLITMAGWGVREYLSKPAVDGDGYEIPGSVLGYTMMEIENAIEFELSRTFSWKLGFDFEKRHDSGDGFYDSTYAGAFTRVQYNNPGYVKITLYAAYSKRKYDNIEEAINADPDDFMEEEDLRDREGYKVKLELVRNMYQWTRIPFDVILGAELKSYENSNPIFTYDRTQIYAGVRWRPFDVKR